MKRLMTLLAAAAVAVALSGLFAGTDIGKLQPVRVVCIQRDGTRYLVSTDTGQTGMGVDLESAVSDMKKAASGEIFLDTAEYLLMDPDCTDALREACGILRPGTDVCIADGSTDLEEAGQFLAVHEPDAALIRCASGRCKIPVLKIREGRMEFIGQAD